MFVLFGFRLGSPDFPFFWGFVGICEKIHGIFVGVILPNLIVFFFHQLEMPGG